MYAIRSYYDDYRDTYLAAGLQGTDPQHVGAIEQLINATLERVTREGFPAERVAAALHQYEFSHREVSGDQYPYGLRITSYNVCYTKLLRA